MWRHAVEVEEGVLETRTTQPTHILHDEVLEKRHVSRVLCIVGQLIHIVNNINGILSGSFQFQLKTMPA